MTDRGWLAALGVAVCSALAVSACGGSKPTRNDIATAQALLRASAEVQVAVEPLYACGPKERECYTKGGPALLAAAERQKRTLNAALARTDNGCLKKAAKIISRELDTYAQAGRAATRGDPAAFDDLLSRSSELEIAYSRQVGTCGFTQGRQREIVARIREANVALIRLTDQISDCRTRRCVIRVARRTEESARRGISGLDAYADELTGDEPDCLGPALYELRSGYLALVRAATALQRNDLQVARTAGKRSDLLMVKAARDLASCLQSLG